MILTLSIIVLILLFIGAVSFYATQERMIFFPEPMPKDYLYTFNADFEELFIKSGNATINALHFKVPDPKGVILYFHGNAGSLNSWASLGEEFIKTGYDFFIFDYRGYGKSVGSRSEAYFHLDCQTLYNYLKEKYPENKIVLYGRSLGSGFATYLAMNNKPKALILETPYYSFKSVAQYHFPFIPVGVILRWTIRTDKWIGKVKSPILILHGTEDQVTPYHQSIQFKSLIKPTDDFVTFDGGTHSNIPSYPEYQVYLKKYLD